MTIARVAALLLSGAVPAALGAGAPGWLDGNWGGDAFLPAGAKDFPVAIDVESGANRYQIVYTLDACGGTLELLEATAERAVFREHLNANSSKACADGGKIVITRVDEQHVSYTFFWPDDATLNAYATLRKRELAPR
jgi:hypothetical protein